MSKKLTTNTTSQLNPQLKQYIDECVKLSHKGSKEFHYNTVHDFAKQEGRYFTSIMEEIPDEWRQWSTHRQCYYNAAKLALAFPEDLKYCEGYASSIIPTSHAWCTTKKGEVVDPTWRTQGKIDKSYLHEYLGVEFSFQFLSAHYCYAPNFGSLLDCWDLRWYLMKEPFDGTFDKYVPYIESNTKIIDD